MTRKKILLFLLVTIISLSYARTDIQNITKNYKQFELNVEDVKVEMLNSDYWVSKLKNTDKLLMDKSKIEKYNKKSFDDIDVLIDLNDYPTILSKEELITKINSISSISKYDRFFENGEKLTTKIYDEYLLNLNKKSITTKNVVKFGLVVNKGNMRTFPVEELILNSEMNKDIDRFQETAIFPGEAVAILHESLDGKWLLVQKYNYLAWVKKEKIAIGDRTKIMNYNNERKNVLVITGKAVRTVYNPKDQRVSELSLDMGLTFPLVKKNDISKLVDGRNPYTGFVIKMPVRDTKGELIIKEVVIPRSEDVSIGYLPFTSENIIKQSFKLLGERYGWGNLYNSRDCTGFTLSIYNTFGIVMARNSSEQGKKAIGKSIDLKGKTLSEKNKIFKTVTVGDEIYMPGHVMLYIGSVDGKTYIIHDTESSSLNLKGVSITTIDYLEENFNSIKSFRLL